MLTFIALRPWKLCWRCTYLVVYRRVGGLVDVEDVEDVGALKMLIRWRCWRCWRCWYVEVSPWWSQCCLSPWKCFQDSVVDVNEKKRVMRIRPWLHACLYQQNSEIAKNTRYLLEKQNWLYFINLKNTKSNLKPRTTYPRYVVRVLNSFEIFWTYEKSTKQCKHRDTWHFANSKIIHEILSNSGESPTSTLYLYIYIHKCI